MGLFTQIWTVLLIFLLTFNPCLIGAMRCSLVPDGISPNTPRSRIGTICYGIYISGQPKGYAPGETYIIRLRSCPKSPVERNFKKFIFVVEHQDAERGYSEDQDDKVGRLEIIGDKLSTFNKECKNSIVQTSDLPKPEVTVSWIAPESGSGCVVFKASIAETNKQWFSEDDLSKRLCEQVENSTDVQPEILDSCRACTEAKYEMTFEGLWSRNTFPHNFPDDAWRTRFSDVIGASHGGNYKFWSPHEKANEALKELAENGNTALIEEDLKVNDESIRTIIKAKGLSFPNTTGRTYAAFRVDKNRHLISLVASIIPSPDWFVGVADYELCTSDGSWLESAIYNLYPLDAGTDGGITYTDPDSPLDPGHPVRRILSNSPNDKKSPFYNDEGEDVKPLARLYLTRQKVYEKECDTVEEPENGEQEAGEQEATDVSSNNVERGVSEEKMPEEEVVRQRFRTPRCAVTKFVEAGSCSVTCGSGHKLFKRRYINEEDEFDPSCRAKLSKIMSCTAKVPVCPLVPYIPKEDVYCRLSEWGNFSSCSTRCGAGTKTRERKYLHPEYKEACEANPDKAATVENVECYGSDDNCVQDPARRNLECYYGIWTKCNATCGTGYKARYLIPEGDFEECPAEEVVECYEPPCSEEESKNAEASTTLVVPLLLNSDSLVREGSHLPVVNCKVSQWSSWSRCKPQNRICGDGIQTKTRTIQTPASNGGRRCPRLLQTRPCTKRCKYERRAATADPLQAAWGPASNSEIVIDCVVTEWGEWSQCSQTCGPDGVQYRMRTIVLAPTRNGKTCPNVVDFRKCDDLPNCF